MTEILSQKTSKVVFFFWMILAVYIGTSEMGYFFWCTILAVFLGAMDFFVR